MTCCRIKSLELEISSLRANNQSLFEEVQRKELQMKDLESKWAATKDELNLISQEHAEYKAKAKKVLFEKEKLISSFSETDLTNGGHRLQPAFSKAQLEQAMFVNLLICLFVD